MKKPRDVLLDRHRWAEPKLDSIRQDVLASLQPASDWEARWWRRNSEAPWSFREVLLPIRWHLTGLGAAWVLIILLNLDSSAAAQHAGQNAPSPRQLLAALREHRRQLAELLKPSPNLAEPSEPNALVPEIRGAIQICAMA